MTSFERPEMSVADYGRAAWRRRWVVLLGLVSTVAPAVALTFLQPTVYEATAEMLLQSPSATSVLGTATAPGPSVTDEIQVLEGDVVRQRIGEELGIAVDDLPEVVGAALNGVSANGVSVTVRASDPRSAAVLANAAVAAYIDTKRDQRVQELIAVSEGLQEQVSALEGRVDEIDAAIEDAGDEDVSDLEAERRNLVDQVSLFEQQLDGLRLEVSLAGDSAVLTKVADEPEAPVEPTPERTAALAVVVGLLIGLASALLIDHLDDTVRGPAELARLDAGLPVLAVVPDHRAPDARPIATSTPDDPMVEAYRTLRTNVLFLGLERQMRVIQVTSAVPGEGKTTTAANLAVLLAQAGRSVVIVDADLRRPRIDRVFQVDRTLGLTNNLAGESVDMTVLPILQRLAVLPSGPLPPNPGELLSGVKMSALVFELRSRYDHVIIDSPPVLSVNDAAAIAHHVDGVVIVVRGRRTAMPQVHRTVATLEQVRAPMIGWVVTHADRRSVGADYEYGYAYDTRDDG